MSNAGLDRLAACVWPELPEHYDVALRQAVTFIVERYDPLGIIACGSIIRGNPDARSDFDLYVVHDKPFRQRVQRRFHGIPSEVFVNPAAQIRGYFAEEGKEGRPCTAHMLAAGFVVLQRDAVVQQLVDEARQCLEKPFQLPEQQRIWLRYAVVDLLDNAKDIRASDGDNAVIILNEAVSRLLDYAFLSAGRYLPRPKERLCELEGWQPEIGDLARQYYRAADNETRFEAATRLAENLPGVTTFFEWESEQEQIARK